MTTKPIYLIGGYQTDFARNWAREGSSIYDLFSSTVTQGLHNTQLDAKDIQVGHVANFEGSLYTGQSHLGGFFGHVDPDLRYLPASRHEAACASGSMATLAAMADLESGRYELACVIGIEMMRGKFDDELDRLQGAAWVGQEWQNANYVWPRAFSDMIEEYQQRFGLDKHHLSAISEKNFANAKTNPKAQSRNWTFAPDAFNATDDTNPVIEGHIRRLDCGQVTDGAAVIFLATESRAQEYATKHGISLQSLPKIKGWGHINAPMAFSEKLTLGATTPYLLPHVNALFQQTLMRANTHLEAIDGLELHDCFNITEYMILDHIGLTQPGHVWKLIEEGMFNKNGRLPVNASGGLIGLGHPVGASGIRMALDCAKQVTHQAGDTQISEAKNMLTVNIGGSTTTCVSLLIGQ